MKAPLIPVMLSSIILFSFNQVFSQNEDSRTSQHRLLTAVSWYQNSAEMTALYYQGFNIAQQQLNKKVDENISGKPLAVVVDIDETMLDNSPYESEVINNGGDKSGWKKWTERAIAKPLPGALEFANYAQSKKVEVFYITNRDDEERPATISNLSFAGFPYADDNHLLTRGDTAFSSGSTSSKEGRRIKVAATHTIALLIGDNLNDFSNVFEERKINYGKDAVEQNREYFGKNFIILPNPMYGAWEKPVYDNRNGLSEAEKAELMRTKLR